MVSANGGGEEGKRPNWMVKHQKQKEKKHVYKDAKREIRKETNV